MAQRKSYFMGANRLSGMSSTPEVAVTVKDKKVSGKVLQVIGSIFKTPNGSINVDIKEDEHGNVYMTEINIGRFPMITTIHDSASSLSPAAAYLLSAFDRNPLNQPIDEYKENMMLIRDLDTEPVVVDGTKLPSVLGHHKSNLPDI